MKQFQTDYLPAGLELFKKVFGEDLFNQFDTSLLGDFLRSVYEFGLQQCKDNEMDLYFLEPKKKPTITHEFSYYMTVSKDSMKDIFGDDLYNKISVIKVTPFKWDGLDIKIPEILATTPGIKDRFSPKWVSRRGKNNGTALDLFLQSIFHYGYQFGIDSEVIPARERMKTFVEFLKNQKK